MKIAIVDDTLQSAVALQAVLTKAGFEVPIALPRADALSRPIDLPGIKVVLLHSKAPDHPLLDALARFALQHACAIVVFTEDRDPVKLRYAMQVGVGAYVIDGFEVGRVQAVIDVALARYEELQLLYKKIERLETALLERKIVERAKGVVMRRRSCDEQTAYRAIQKAAMDRNLKMVDVARQVLTVSDLMHS